MPTTTKQVRVPSVKALMRGIVTPDGFEREETTETYGHGEFRQTIPILVLRSPDVEIKIDFYTGKDRANGYGLGSGHVTFDSPRGRLSFDRYGVEDSFYIDNPRQDRDPYAKGFRFPFIGNERVVSGKTGRKGTVVDAGIERAKQVRPYSILWDGETEPEQFTVRRLKAHGVRKTDVIDRANESIRRYIEERIPQALETQARSTKVPGIPFSVTPERKQQVTAALKSSGHYSFMPSGFGTGYTLSTRYRRGSGGSGHAKLAEFFGVPVVYVSTFDAD